MLVIDEQAGGFFEIGVETVHVNIGTVSSSFRVAFGFRQEECIGIALLLADVFHDSFYFGCIYESTLHTHRVIALQVKHISLTDELLRSGAVENGT